MKLADLKSPDCAFEAGADPIALIPIGAVEQHSRHLPLGTDALIVERIAEEVESRAHDRILLLPTVYVGASDHHLSLPGSVSVGTVVVAETVARTCLSLYRSTGIRRFLVLNGHGGNQPAARLALEQIHAAGPAIEGYAVDYWSLMFDELDRRSLSRPPAMGHADLIETSILLAMRPELVDMVGARADGYRDELPAGVATTAGIPDRSAHGGVGDPTGATEGRGRAYLHAAVTSVLQLSTRLESVR